MSMVKILTCADPNTTVAWGAVVTVKAFVGVTNVSLCTKFAQLLGTHPAAPTGVRHQAHTGRTLGWYIRALALSTALLSHSLRNIIHALVRLCTFAQH